MSRINKGQAARQRPTYPQFQQSYKQWLIKL